MTRHSLWKFAWPLPRLIPTTARQCGPSDVARCGGRWQTRADLSEPLDGYGDGFPGRPPGEVAEALSRLLVDACLSVHGRVDVERGLAALRGDLQERRHDLAGGGPVARADPGPTHPNNAHAVRRGSGDHNTVHLDVDIARRTGLDDVFAHGMLSMGRIWAGC
ncbi:MaoC/PaaZ C-terminal domain-containing protein [Nonomuraea endophytica]|uniref:MaoC/PaaZ C-terminal domain-containing protein n=1 Tax=Nonomuraea endophytica TaxID=714136 RepID=UPI0037CBBCF3